LSPFALFNIAAVVQISFTTVATELKAPVSFQVQSPNLVRARHCKDQRVTVYCHDIPRTRKTLGFGGLVSLFVETFFASSDNGQNFFAREIYFANCVIFRVAQIQKVIALAKNVADALRVVELGL
jgi:hypothetical protein